MPTVRLSATPNTLVETEGTVLTLNFQLDEPPPTGGVTVTVRGDVLNNTDDSPALNSFNLLETQVTGGEFPVANQSFTGFDFTITAQTATISIPIFNDDESDPSYNGLRSITYALQPGTGYTLDASASSTTVQLADDRSQVPAPTPTPTPTPPVTGSILGTPGRDRLRGTAVADTIDGRGGKDTILGLGGNDVLSGGAGNDTLRGANGRDTLFGGRGRDLLIGGGGRDFFVLEQLPGRDIIQDFKRQDRLGLSDGLSFGQIDVSQRGNNTLIEANGKALAILRGVDADQIRRSSFVDIS